MVSDKYTTAAVLDIIRDIPDPEIPVLTLTDLGIVKDIEFVGEEVKVTITPTYIGCPAMKVFEDDIAAKLRENGYENIRIEVRLSPAWTTDWMTEEGRNKLKAYGIAPPLGSADKSALTGGPSEIPCPNCDSLNTQLISQFGSTPCKALYKCLDCKEPFDYFKCL